MSCNSRNNAITTGPARANGVGKLASQGAMAFETPAVKVETATRRYGRFELGPLTGSQATTLGNALRRTLLSSIKGSAVTSFKVEGIDHEFTTIPNVREDMTALTLNLKDVRLRFNANKPARLSLRLKGEGAATAGDLVVPDHVEVVNPDLPLLTGDNDKADIKLSLTAEPGYGYSPSEERSARRRDGDIPLDAVFSPVVKTAFHAEQAGVADAARAGQPYQRLVVEVKTDGSLSPEAALRQAAGRLSSQFGAVARDDWLSGKAEIPPFAYRRTLAQMPLEPRTRNALQRGGYQTLLDTMKALRSKPETIRTMKGMGQKSYDDLLATLDEQPLSPGDKRVLRLLRQPPLDTARDILQEAAASSRFKSLDWRVDGERVVINGSGVQSARDGHGYTRRLLQELQGTGVAVEVVNPSAGTAGVWQALCKEGLCSMKNEQRTMNNEQ